MLNNPRSQPLDVGRLGLIFLGLALVGFIACHGILAARAWITSQANKPVEARR